MYDLFYITLMTVGIVLLFASQYVGVRFNNVAGLLFCIWGGAVAALMILIPLSHLLSQS